MSLPPPPYAAVPEPRPRPKKRWWFVGALLLVAAVVVFAVGLWQTLASATRTDAVVDATATAVQVGVEPGEERMFFVPQRSPVASCTLTDADGEELLVTRSFTSTTVTVDGRTWQGAGVFTSSTAEVTVDCTASDPGTLVRIGSPLGAGFVGGLLLTVLAPVALGLAGLAVLLTTTVLWFTREPAPAGGPGGGPGGGPAGPPAPPSPPPPGW